MINTEKLLKKINEQSVSWDTLMDVIDKIESIELNSENYTDYFDVWIMPDCVRINKQSEESLPLIVVNKSEVVGSILHEIYLFEDKKQATIDALSIFLKWYNYQYNKNKPK